MGKEGTQVPISKKFEKNIEYLQKELRIEKNFDVVHQKLDHGGRKIGMFFVDGFADDVSLIEVLKSLNLLKDNELDNNPIETLTQTIMPHQEIETSEDLEEVIGQLLAGHIAFIVEGSTTAILVDAREYPARSPEEPDLERVVRGPRDGFVETLVFNAALIRRRIRDRSLIMEYLQVGQRSKTDIALAYIDSIADQELVERIRERIEVINTDGLSMGEKTLEEFIFGKNLNPYPMIRYTERGDTSGVHLMEGHILIVVDGSPSVMICPTTYWHHLEHAEEYRQKPVIGAALRWIRFMAVFASLFLLPLWYLAATNPSILDGRWAFVGPDEIGEISLFWQIFIAEIGVEMLRMSAIHTPNALATALGVVAAILIGDIAVEAGLFSVEVVLYLAAAVVGSYATPSYELALANRFFRVAFLIIAAIFGVYGFVLAVTLWLILLVSTKTLNTPFMWPLLPFSPKEFLEVLVRSPIPLKDRRPSVLNTKDETSQ
ncbi:stage V sporulation protein AF [Virgibacillus natechei]|uniref:Stage V sporulation protein AF n=1 Tax=Virgibacillus natechei TaxID=1216297 RepID=A0ABS4IHN8_9BACI|nr:spore germination protein [Virgibacillus natechei]MBP1970474.1 stage V sporulation protein AF [Virgibacillus natechei]UZD13877.1 spore germination protein [Virgibacillus natechei]